MFDSRYSSVFAPCLLSACLLSACDDAGADATNGTVNGSTAPNTTASGSTAANTTAAVSTTAAGPSSGGTPTGAGTTTSGGPVTSASGTGGANTSDASSSASTGMGGSAGDGGTTSQATTTGEAGTGGNGGGGTSSVAPRTECPTAPPATQKDPASDRSLAVSKDDYAQMLTKETPFEGTRGQLPWHLYTPPQAADNAGQRFPLIVVLHGGYGREVMDGNIMVDVAQYLLGSQNGLLTEANRAAFPAYIVLPHCRVEEGCNFGSNEWASAGGAHYQVQAEPSVAGGTALELVEHVIDTYAVDPTRVYLTGNSMGGGGTWEFASRRPELFAAVLPVSGHPPALEFLTPIVDAKLPVWAFGGQNDTTNPYPDTVEAIDTIDSAGGCAWLTTYNNTSHDDALWSSPYLEPDLWTWLFAQSNSSAPR